MNLVQPTKALKAWRTKNAKNQHIITASAPSEDRASPTSSTFSSGIAASTHLDASFRIENSTYISTGGQKASVLRCPSPQEYHENLWNPKFGRGGTLIRQRSLSFTQSSTSDSNPSGKVHGSKPNFSTNAKTFPNSHIQKLSAVGVLRAWKAQVRKEKDQGSKTMNGPLPGDCCIPNGMFARKYGYIKKGEPLPYRIIRGLMQPTLDDLYIQRYDELWDSTMRKLDDQLSVQELDDIGRAQLQDDAVDAFLDQFKFPANPGLFFDGGLDFVWGKGSSTTATQHSLQSDDVSSHGKRGSMLHSSPDEAFPKSQSSLESEINATTRSRQFELGQPASNFFSGISDPLKLETSKSSLSGHENHKPRRSRIAVSSSFGGNHDPVDQHKIVTRDVDLKTYMLPKTTYISKNLHNNSGQRSTDFEGPPEQIKLKSYSSSLSRKHTKNYQGKSHSSDGSVEKSKVKDSNFLSLATFDGAADDIHHGQKYINPRLTNKHNTRANADCANPNSANNEMDLTDGASHISHSPSRPKPLHIRKQSSQIHIANQHNSSNHSEIVHPPRTSSIRSRHPADSEIFNLHSTCTKTPSVVESAPSAHSSYRAQYISDTSINSPSTARSTVSSYKGRYLSRASSEIMGDFIPVDASDMTPVLADKERSKASFDA